MPAKVVLKVIAGPIEGQVFSFAEHDTFLFGRHNDCHARLPDDPRVSRHHFILEADPPHATLRDLGSRNGTYVNGAKYGGRAPSNSPKASAQRLAAEIDIEDGDRIRVGRTEIEVHVVVPVTCRECGKEFDSGQANAVPSASDYVCPACRPEIPSLTLRVSMKHRVVKFRRGEKSRLAFFPMHRGRLASLQGTQTLTRRPLTQASVTTRPFCRLADRPDGDREWS